MDYIATFHTHFAALSFARRLQKQGIPVEMMPVPRALSASCGTCAAFSCAEDLPPLLAPDVEAVYAVEDGTYTEKYRDEA